jgi:hypothetical protein
MRLFRRSDRPKSIPGVVRVGDKTIEALHALGTRRPGLTRAGRLSLAGLCEGRKVKVYSAHSRRQIELRLALQDAYQGTLRFPAVIACSDHLVVEEWVDGTTLANADMPARESAMAAVQRFIRENHDSPALNALAQEFADAFCYFEHYLLARIGPWLHWDNTRAFVESWKAEYISLQSGIPVRVSHPDLSRCNIVIATDTRELYVVDNELIGSGRGWILDCRNSLLGKSGASDAVCPDERVPPDFIERSWKLRQLGKHLNLGNVEEAYAILLSEKQRPHG